MTNFNIAIYFNGYEFFTYDEMANFLIENYPSAINLVKDNTIFTLIKEGSIELYDELYNATKDFEYCENVLTYIIYRLSRSSIFVTRNNRFKTTYEMALAMKRSYPDLNNDILVLLKDKVLSKIYWDEYLFTKDVRHKRNHDFLVNVEESSKYLLSYFYFLIIHLPKDEKINFIVNNIKFNSIDELIAYIYTNQKNIQQLITEIKKNDFVLGLIASKTSINSVISATTSDNYLDFLYLINNINQDNESQKLDFTAILTSKMCVWLSKNYQNYTYESTRAKRLLKEFSNVVKKENMTFLELFTQVKYLDELYEEFLYLYKSDRIIINKSEIIADSDDYHLGYLYNNEIVCSRYLHDFDLVKEDILTPEYILAQEKSLVISKLDKEGAKLEKHNDLLLDYYNQFDKERYNLINYKFLIKASLTLSIVTGLLFIFLDTINFVSVHEQFAVYALSIISLPFLIFALVFTTLEYNKLADINKKQRSFKKYIKRINKAKIEVTNLKYYKEEIIQEETDEEQVVNNSIVKKRINLNFLNYNKFYNNALKINRNKVIVKRYEYNFIAKLAICLAFLPALILSTHVILNIFNFNVNYLFVEEFPLFYLILTFINIVLISNKKPYRNTFICFVASIGIAILMSIL